MIPVLVTTVHRGVFFGFAQSREAIESREKVWLTNARNCIRWEASVGGFLGLANVGPTDALVGVGKSVPELLLHDITAVAVCTESATAVWVAK